MLKYYVNSFDVCVPGYERLRSQDEFILATPIAHDSDLDQLVSELKQDIQSCERFAGFDYDAARKAVDDWVVGAKPLFAQPNPFDLETADYGEEDNLVTLYLYVKH